MRRIRWLLAMIIVSLCARAQQESRHLACSWCHTAATTPIQQVSAAKKTLLPKRASTTCLSCHDGVAAEDLDLGHLNHMPTGTRRGLDCTACHDPHDRWGSYRLLHVKNERETEQTATMAFCRECHTDH